MTRKLLRHTVGLIGTVALAAGLSLGVGTTPASAQDDKARGGEHCAYLVGKAGADGNSPLLDKQCSTISEDDARQQLRSPGHGDVEIAAKTKLVKLYNDMNYHGYYDIFYGNSGTCDSAGYTIRLPRYNATRVSSVAKYGNCTGAKFWDADGFYRTQWSLPRHYLHALNDNVGKIKVFRKG